MNEEPYMSYSEYKDSFGIKNYRIYIKSHSEAPDYEDYCEADSKEDAAEYFQARIGRHGDFWDIEVLLDNIEEVVD